MSKSLNMLQLMFLSWMQRLNINRYEPKKTLMTKWSNEKKQNKECVVIGLTTNVDDSVMFLAKINKLVWPHVFTLRNITHLSNLSIMWFVNMKKAWMIIILFMKFFVGFWKMNVHCWEGEGILAFRKCFWS